MTILPPSLASADRRNEKPREASRGLAMKTGAGNETRTRDLNLGKVALYQLSYSRPDPDEGRYCTEAVE